MHAPALPNAPAPAPALLHTELRSSSCRRNNTAHAACDGLRAKRTLEAAQPVAARRSVEDKLGEVAGVGHERRRRRRRRAVRSGRRRDAVCTLLHPRARVFEAVLVEDAVAGRVDEGIVVGVSELGVVVVAREVHHLVQQNACTSAIPCNSRM